MAAHDLPIALGVSSAAVNRYDFRRPEGLDRVGMAAVRTLFDLTARLMSARLGASLHSRVSASIESVAEIQWGSFEEHLGEHGAVLGIELSPFPVEVICYLPHEITAAMVDMRLAGPGRRSYPPRALSDLERRVLKAPFDAVSEALANAAASVDPAVSLGRVHQPAGLGNMQLIDDAGQCVVAKISVRLAAGVEHPLFYCVPVVTMRPIVESAQVRSALTMDRERPRSAEIARLAAELPTRLVLRFPEAQVTLGVLRALEAGSILALDHPADEPLVLEAGGAMLFRANRVLKGRRLAAQVTAVLDGAGSGADAGDGTS